MSYYNNLEFAFTFTEASYCDHLDYNREVEYSTLFEAKSACSGKRDCNLVYDHDCDGTGFWTCSGNIVHSTSNNSCTWLKGIYHDILFRILPLNHYNVLLYNEIEFSILFSFLDTGISPVGKGWCRPYGCDITNRNCRVNGFYKDGSSYQDCSTTCLTEIACVGFALSDETSAFPNRCFVYGNIWQQNTSSGWVESPQQYFDIHTSNKQRAVTCYSIPYIGNSTKNMFNFNEY